MLAYLFWHSPAPSASSYQDHLRAFHQALILNAPDGFLSSASFRVAGLAWLPDTECYEDWYLVQDFSSLGLLNEAAISGRRKRKGRRPRPQTGQKHAGYRSGRQAPFCACSLEGPP